MSDHRDRPPPKADDRWRHYKGAVVQVICLAREEATLEDVVVYRHGDATWTRPLREWMGLVMVEKTPWLRFSLVGENCAPGDGAALADEVKP